MSKVFAVNVIIKNSQGECLLQMRDGSENIKDPLKWGFFGGGVEHNETPVVAAQRELEEELGLKINLNDLHLIKEVKPRADKTVYVVELKKCIAWSEVLLSEGAGAGFFSRDEIYKINLSEAAKAVTQLYEI